MAQFIYTMYKVRKSHGDKVILDDVTLSFLPGAKIGVVGPNGAGKSSVLKIMAGLDQPSNGDARLTGRVTTRVFVGNQWLLAVETELGKLHVAQPNHGAPPPEEGREVGLAWTDDDLRVLTREGTHGNA